ncbi:hypothetical protein VTO42DRAFT_7425 [Malbranchea cinnamomea]
MSGSATFARALTRRHKRPEVSAPMPVRENQIKLPPGTIRRSQISLPTELISTTNLLAYTAPDLPSHTTSSAESASSSTASFRTGGDDSDLNSSSRGSSTPATSPDTTSLDTSPISAEPNHQPTYFVALKRSSTTHSASQSQSSTSSSAANVTPAVPQRSLSHTKKSHQELARQRSRSKMTPPPTSLSNIHAARVNHDQENRYTPELHAHPFGKELEKVNEVAEEFGAIMDDDEERILLSKGFCKFSVEDYLLEIEDLYHSLFADEEPTIRQAWI